VGPLLRFAPITVGPLALAGCISAATAVSDTHNLVSAAPLQTEFSVQIRDPKSNVIVQAPLSASTASPGYEKEYLGFVLIDSGQKCQEFADRLSTAQRGVDTSFDILSGVLSALATAFTPLATVHALTAAATISTATKSAINADVYARAAASLILQQINNTYYVEIKKYRDDLLARDDRNIVPALEVSSIEAIHRQCSLDSALAALSQAGTVANAAAGAAAGAAKGASEAAARNQSPTEGAILGAAIGAAAGAAGPTAAAPSAAATQGANAAVAAISGFNTASAATCLQKLIIKPDPEGKANRARIASQAQALGINVGPFVTDWVTNPATDTNQLAAVARKVGCPSI
jgi:hypothetical protein